MIHPCRDCGQPLGRVFVDLGVQPLSNAYVPSDQLDDPEPRYPLRPYICDECFLVQVPVYETPESIFGDYAYFSSQSRLWVEHCEKFAQETVRWLKLGPWSRVLELASNDGALVKAFHRRGVPAVGVEPAANVARHAILKGSPTIDSFFGRELAAEMVAEGFRADLVCANNVIAHVPDLDDFIGGIKTVLAEDGVVSIEFPSLVNLIEENQFDTIYHEHFSYFTLRKLAEALQRRGLEAFDAIELPTHGGSWRLLAGHDGSHPYRQRLMVALETEDASAGDASGYGERAVYERYAEEPAKLKVKLLRQLTDLRSQGLRIAGYGAPAKASTLLNYCGIGPEIIEFIVDSTPYKQGKFMPGVRIPIRPESELQERKPDVIVILPWNWSDEIQAKILRDCDWNPTVICRGETLPSREADLPLAA